MSSISCSAVGERPFWDCCSRGRRVFLSDNDRRLLLTIQYFGTFAKCLRGLRREGVFNAELKYSRPVPPLDGTP